LPFDQLWYGLQWMSRMPKFAHTIARCWLRNALPLSVFCARPRYVAAGR
jgi:hypothetical protein